MQKYRLGNGVDTHRFCEGRPLILGGVTIPFEKGLLGHSDADVLTHAIIDALLGAAALDDIGTHFPDTDAKYKDISSLILLEKTREMITATGFQIGQVDATIITQMPKMRPYIPAIRQSLADCLHLALENVSIKAKTTEGLGFIGRGEGMVALATATLLSL
ncbi:MAG: 2-C-methyl-D-erythritol 2,4-cyclodiphosphate synthase [Candidatus Marinimicrobia bacterium]|jgi:2-C-methyl-D-erythritol 2,4-cyclodiphosphate synthase|nr:2-C-methyl-D-erythritol 2,4-cyclodiphosphate synthase [Candidatus Neomarinimicrobiota bacterium]MCK9559578.1 2-C-methyl-D-erythritol 2,4-cyclodiphosphate synthase [Candidatus Neomarinimicrobiota bacterium]MDD5061048.1 2-C-methyl-D-erythritol 2,4-cyclodiphosphate synthase [Candidatus Neomarinimicrobiota bacterium]